MPMKKFTVALTTGSVPRHSRLPPSGGLVFDHAVRGTERGTRGDVEIQEAITNVFAECFSTDNQFGITVAAVLPCVLNEVLSAFLATLDNYTLASAALKPKDFRGVLQVDG
jgi:hypothetical protein